MRGVEVVMGEGERAWEIRRKTQEWKQKAKEVLRENGLASRNLELFVNSLSKYK
ncbi:hypothetical protein MA16_Dca029201 [Dendrobium catenatum]|uniref:Uncharacterized protein n=1 Tax=Dendrobium catenatum TaxID=906689 RepID=A0A2I0VGZ8_9ASPA|nr:hypothetical protein MA16_Dca029201 [Dendrobium catenatum]